MASQRIGEEGVYHNPLDLPNHMTSTPAGRQSSVNFPDHMITTPADKLSTADLFSVNRSLIHDNTLHFINMPNHPTPHPKANKRPSTIDMVCQAIESLGSGNAGSSVQAIKKWILGNYTHVTESRIQVHLKKALVKGLEDCTLERPPRLKTKKGAIGSFCLSKNFKKANNVNGNDAFSGEPSTSFRLYPTDTEVDVVRKSIVFEVENKTGSTKRKVAFEAFEKSDTDLISEETGPTAWVGKQTMMKVDEKKATLVKPARKRRNSDFEKENTLRAKRTKAVNKKESVVVKTNGGEKRILKRDLRERN